jgi:acetyltransferase
MIDRLQSKKLLNGYRGMAPLERDIMAHILVKLGAIGVANPEIGEIDINPFILCEGKPVAVDASIILK